MRIKPHHPNFKVPTKGSSAAGAYDLYMPEGGTLYPGDSVQVFDLGFSAQLPDNHVGLILPRSGKGAKYGLDLNNTCGVIDADYRGPWLAYLRMKTSATRPLNWLVGERLLQVLVVPVTEVDIEIVDELPETDRGEGGFGSSG